MFRRLVKAWNLTQEDVHGLQGLKWPFSDGLEYCCANWQHMETFQFSLLSFHWRPCAMGQRSLTDLNTELKLVEGNETWEEFKTPEVACGSSAVYGVICVWTPLLIRRSEPTALVEQLSMYHIFPSCHEKKRKSGGHETQCSNLLYKKLFWT